MTRRERADLILEQRGDEDQVAVLPNTPEGGAWLLEKYGVKGALDNTNEQGAREIMRKAERAGFTVVWRKVI